MTGFVVEVEITAAGIVFVELVVMVVVVVV